MYSTPSLSSSFRFGSIVCIFVLLLLMLPAVACADSISSTIVADSVAVSKDFSDITSAEDSTLTLPRKQRADWWWNRLRNGTLEMSDSTIDYPRFLGFCVGVYNWANHAFNYYEPEYVQGTGKRWKARLVNDNWLDSYAMDFKGDVPIWMLSVPYCQVGFYLQYMAVSLGYNLDVSNVIGNKPLLHKRLELGFTCARFTVEGYYNENTGGTYLRRFGDYNNGHIFKMHIPGVSFTSYGINAYYFFNHTRYSQGCVYSFSNLQKRSAGSFIAGFSVSNHDIDIDFSTLPQEMLEYLHDNDTRYSFDYNDYSLIAGYGYNLVFGKGFVFNVTAAPSLSIKHSKRGSSSGRHNTLSLNILGRIGLVYNVNEFFFGVSGKMDGHWFRGRTYNFFNSVESLSASVGVRF